jgi:hypothetical protein
MMDDLNARVREAELRLEEARQRIKALEELAGRLAQTQSLLRQAPAT